MPDGERNNLYIQRLKDKLGNRSNASSEIELLHIYGVMVGDEGRGIRTIIDMVQHNRYYCAASSSGLMRQSLVQALHHTSHRSAFQRRLIDQPLMRNVLADLALETEASLALTLRIGRAMDEAADALRDELADQSDLEIRARGVTELMAVCLQAAQLVRHAPAAVADAFCASRLGQRWHGAYGALPAGSDFGAILARATPGG